MVQKVFLSPNILYVRRQNVYFVSPFSNYQVYKSDGQMLANNKRAEVNTSFHSTCEGDSVQMKLADCFHKLLIGNKNI